MAPGLLALILNQVPALAEADAPVGVLMPQALVSRTVAKASVKASMKASEPEPPEFKPGTPGVCRFYNLSGYAAVAADGQLVMLRPYCDQQRNWVWYEEGRFWSRFRDAATSETLAFAQTLNRHEVEVYALSICPFLEEGGTLQELTQLQADQRFPVEFEQAVTVAAVKTYCRQYRDQL